MLDLRDALRDLQEGHESLGRMAAAAAFDEYRHAFEQTVGHVRGALYAIQRAVRTAARQESGRPRLEAAAQWCAREQAAVDADPLLRWVRDAGSGSVEPGDTDAVAVAAPTEHGGAPLPASARTPDALLRAALTHCETRYERALTQWG